MRTRRSPRNQERLYRALGTTPPAPRPSYVTAVHPAMVRRLVEEVKTKRRSLWGAMKAIKVVTDSHYSDLYVPVTPDTRALVEAYVAAGFSRPSIFACQTDGGTPWYDVAFAYEPYWLARQGK